MRLHPDAAAAQGPGHRLAVISHSVHMAPSTGYTAGGVVGVSPAAPPYTQINAVLTIVLQGRQSGDQDVKEEPQENEANEE